MFRKMRTENKEASGTDGSLNDAFSNVVKTVSEMHSYAQSQLKVSFQAGEHHGLEKLFQWIIQQQNGSQLTVLDIMSYLQGELACKGNVSIASEFQPQRSLPTSHIPSLTSPMPNTGAIETYSTTPPSTCRDSGISDLTLGLGSYSLSDSQGSHSQGYDPASMQMYTYGNGTSNGNLQLVNNTRMEHSLEINDVWGSTSRSNTEGYISQAHTHDGLHDSMMDMHTEGPGQ